MDPNTQTLAPENTRPPAPPPPDTSFNKSPKAPKKRLLIIGVLIVLLLGGGVGAYVLLGNNRSGSGGTSKAAKTGSSASANQLFSFDRNGLEKEDNITGPFPTIETYVTGTGVDTWRLNIYETPFSTLENAGYGDDGEFTASYANYYYDESLIQQGTQGVNCGAGKDEAFTVPGSPQSGHRYSVCHQPTRYDLLSAVTSKGTVVTLYATYYHTSQVTPRAVEKVFQSFHIN